MSFEGTMFTDEWHGVQSISGFGPRELIRTVEEMPAKTGEVEPGVHAGAMVAPNKFAFRIG